MSEWAHERLRGEQRVALLLRVLALLGTSEGFYSHGFVRADVAKDKSLSAGKICPLLPTTINLGATTSRHTDSSTCGYLLHLVCLDFFTNHRFP